MSYMVHYRLTPETDNLKKEDYVRGFGMNSSHYYAVMRARERMYPDKPQRTDFKETWDRRSGHYITGEPIITRHHHLHDYKLFHKEKKVYYIIDEVCKHFEYGYYMVLIIREEGTESHRVVFWENINCEYDTVLEGIKEANKEFELVKS